MSSIECPREREVLDAVREGRWLDDQSELREHAASCGVCSDLVTVTSAFRAARTPPLSERSIPTAAHVWWRAALRSRQEAARTAERPIAFVQGLAAACAGGLAATAIGFGWSSGLTPAAAAEELSRLVAAVAAETIVSAQSRPHLVLTAGALVAGAVLLSVALYVALSEE
jgi:hypothetical protein